MRIRLMGIHRQVRKFRRVVIGQEDVLAYRAVKNVGLGWVGWLILVSLYGCFYG